MCNFLAPGLEGVCGFGSELSFRLFGRTLTTKQVSPSDCLELFIIVFGESFNPVIGCLGEVCLVNGLRCSAVWPPRLEVIHRTSATQAKTF